MKTISQLFAYSVLIFIALVMLGPFLWLISTSLKGTEEIFSWPPVFIPKHWQFENYVTVWNAVPFGRYFVNSIIIALGTVTLTVFTSALAAYPLARLSFPGRSLIFTAIISTLIIPQEVIVIPLYTLVLKLGLADTLIGVMLPFSTSAFSIYLLRQAYLTVPRELEEAAMIDGASTFRIWWSVALPLIKPSVAALVVLTFISSWGDFLWPLIVLRSPEHYTLQVGLSMMVQSLAANYKLVAAGAVVSVVPVIVLFLFTQKYFVSGILMGSGK